MEEFIRGSSSYVRLEVHVTFKVKYCHKVFDFVEFRTRCEQIFCEVAENEKVVVEEMGFDRDHVHMVWFIRVYHNLADLAKKFKGTSGRKLLKEFPYIKKRFFWGSGLWAGEIFCDTVGKEPTEIKN